MNVTYVDPEWERFTWTFIGRRREATRLAAILRWRVLDLMVRASRETMVELAAASLYAELNPGDDWNAAPFEMQETFRCDADRALTAALGPSMVRDGR